MNDIPDWLWQGLAVWAAAKGIEWTWLHKEAIAQWLGIPRDIRRSVADEIGLTDTVTVTKDVDLRWRVESPTPSLARRLEDLAVWYLHVS